MCAIPQLVLAPLTTCTSRHISPSFLVLKIDQSIGVAIFKFVIKRKRKCEGEAVKVFTFLRKHENIENLRGSTELESSEGMLLKRVTG